MKKNLVRLFCLTTLMSFLLFGCGAKEVAQTTEEPKVETTTSNESVEEESKEEIKEEKQEEPVVAETETEEQVTEDPEREIVNELENEDGTITIFSKQKVVTEEEKAIEEWTKSIKDEKPRLAIWNTETSKKMVLEPNTEYQIEEGDKIILCYYLSKEKYEIGFVQANLIEEVKKYFIDEEVYTELKYRKDLKEKNIEFTLDCKDVDTGIYYGYSYFLTLP